MRPISLSFTAFGSYPGTETIDFTALSQLGLYVVTGPTGSGKTTVFDAMAYALYGKVPGEREPGDIRSHHAPATTACSVVFRFAVDGVVHRVERSPEQLRPAKRSGAELVRRPASASLVRESDDVTLASQATRVATACAELVGLTADQFERVVLLPQGRFQQFLLANTKERQPLLRQLFDTGRWLTVTERLKARSAEAKAEVAAIEAQLGNHRHSLISNLRQAAEYLGAEVAVIADDESVSEVPLDSLTEVHAQLDTAASARRVAAEAAARASRAASERETNATRIGADWTSRRDLRLLAAQLDAQAPSIEAARSQLDADTMARPILIAAEALDAALGAVSIADAERDSARCAVIDACPAAGVAAAESPEALVAAIADARAGVERERDALTTITGLQSALDAIATDITGATSEQRVIAQDVTAIDDALVGHTARLDELAPVISQVAARQQAVISATERLGEAGRAAALVSEITAASALLAAATDEQRALTARFVAGVAPRLAATLVADEACPVCGSLEHPAPAAAAAHDHVDPDQLEAAASAVTVAATALEARNTELLLLRTSLGADLDRPIEQFEMELSSAGAALTEATTAADEHAALLAITAALGADRDGLLARSAELDVVLAALGADRSNAESQLSAARSALGELIAGSDPVGDASVEALDRRVESLEDLDRAVGVWSTALAEHVATQGALGNARAAYDTALRASVFPDRAAVEAAQLSEQLRSELTATVAAFVTSRSATDARLIELEALELPMDCPDITELSAEAERRRLEAQELAAEVSRLDERLGQAAADLDSVRSITETAAGAFERHDQLRVLANTCDGQGPRRVALETWVLAGELDRVVLAASVHLERMTAGRYRLERTDAADHGAAQAGLDLRVLDAHTGVARRPGSLSGGEQFQASLALALGLADVVSQGGPASGRVFEALFVDEGFGSLDPDSLGNAVDALHQIHATGRTVGVITHVEAMKEDLQLGIRVHRLPDGKGSTLTCHPEV